MHPSLRLPGPLRLIRLLPLVLATLLASSALRAQEAPRLQEGRPLIVRFDESETLKVFRFKCRPDASALHIRVSGSEDFDLFVAEQILTEDSLYEALFYSEGMNSSDKVLVEPVAKGNFGAATEWYVHVYIAWMTDVQCEAELFLWEDRPGHLLLPPGRTVLEPVAGAAATGGYVYVSGHDEGSVVRAECARGIPALRMSQESKELEGETRGKGVEVTYDRVRGMSSGVWKVEVTPPEGAADRRVAVDVAPLQSPAIAESMPARLEGAQGEIELYDEEMMGVYGAYLDVDASIMGFEIVATMPDGNFELHAGRQPFELGAMRRGAWSTCGGAATKRLLVGGDAPLPTGRFWIELWPTEAGGEVAKVTWKCYRQPPGATRGAVPSIRGGTPVPLLFDLGADRVSFAPDPAPTMAAQFRIFDSTSALDLLLVRRDTGEVIASSMTFRRDEHLRLDRNYLLPEGTAVLVEAVRWTADHRAEAGELHYSPVGRIEAPEGYLPPYACWSQEPRHRALASTVAIMTPEGGGSGVVVSPSGLILTSWHVVADSSEILLGFPCTRKGAVRETFGATVIDHIEDLDLALLKVNDESGGLPLPADLRFHYAPLGRALDLDLGDPLRVLGYPDSSEFNTSFNLTVLAGLAAAFERDQKGLSWLVTDARTGYGNSGGGAFDARFRLVGVLTHGAIGESLGFARPTESIPNGWKERILKEGGSTTE